MIKLIFLSFYVLALFKVKLLKREDHKLLKEDLKKYDEIIFQVF